MVKNPCLGKTLAFGDPNLLQMMKEAGILAIFLKRRGTQGCGEDGMKILTCLSKCSSS
jgi:hypothetical protein